MANAIKVSVSYLLSLVYIVTAVLVGGCANCTNAQSEHIDWPEPEVTLCLYVHPSWSEAGWDREWISEAADWWAPAGVTFEVTDDASCERDVRVAPLADETLEGEMKTVHGVRKHIVIDPKVADKYCEFGHCYGGSVVTLLAHEMGHMLGAKHSSDQADLMWHKAATWAHRYPTAADYDRIPAPKTFQ